MKEIAEQLIDEAYQRSLDELHRNSSSCGFLAAAQGGENYNAVWGRDGAITAIAAFDTDDQELIETGVETLKSLAQYQAPNGQIPAYLLLEDDKVVEAVHGGRGSITAIDANLWFVIACQTGVHKLLRRDLLDDWFHGVYYRTMAHLASIDSDCSGLIEIPVGGDWTDLLNRSYHILYDQVLWWRLLWGAATVEQWCDSEQERQLRAEQADLVHDLLNRHFWWDESGREAARHAYLIGTDIPAEDLLYYQSYLQPFRNRWYLRFDAFANVLAALSGIAPQDRAETIIREVYSRELDQPAPLRVLDPVLCPTDEDWLELYQEKQPPYEYHNGGTWPLAGGFWVSLLAKMGRQDEAGVALTRLAQSLRLNSNGDETWGFHEYLHGKTGRPMGRQHQAWSAAAYILGYHAAKDGRFGCFEDPPQSL